MKHKRMLCLLVLLGLALVAGPALASSVTLSQNLTFGITTSGTAGLAVNEAGSSALAFASAYATAGLTEVGPFSAGGLPVPAPGIASATIPGVSWIGPTQASAVVDGFKFMDLNMSGTSPVPFGSLSQSVFNEIYLTFVADADGGNATVTITPSSQFLNYGVTGQTPTTGFFQLTGYANLQTGIYSESNQAVPSNFQPLLADERFGYFADFTTSGTPASAFSFDLTNLTAGEIVYLDITLTSGYDGLSAVPLPPAVWLFGSGLAGLLLMGRRKHNRS
jgi:hypothetical protein